METVTEPILPPPVICCASGVCCAPGSQEQADAVYEVLLAKARTAHDDEPAATRDHWLRFAASAMVELFTLSDRQGRTRPEDFSG